VLLLNFSTFSFRVHTYDTLSYFFKRFGVAKLRQQLMSMSAFSRNLCSGASRSLRQRSAITCRALRPIASRAAASTPITSRVAATSHFSTMSALKSAAPPVPSNREFDPEIKDVASYVHNTKIDSELAVRTLVS
jgi:hypothetical protein